MKSISGDRANLGGGVSPAQTSPLRLSAPPARAAGAVLSVNASGDVTSGALQVADIPTVFTRRDVAETINQPWNATALPWMFHSGTATPPEATPTGGLGTCLIFWPSGTGTPPYAVGIENTHLWHVVPVNSGMKWYQGTQEAMRLGGDGTLFVLKSGILDLSNSAGYGEVHNSVGLTLRSDNGAGGGGIQFQTGGGLVVPVTGYRENLGQINKKYLTLHAAELWVETLVAQDTLATIGGRVLVGPTTQLTTDLPAAGTDIQLKHNQPQVGDFVMMEAAGKFEIMQIGYGPIGTGPFGYTVYRDLDGSGATDWYAGDAMFNTGQYTGASLAGFIDLYSLRGVKSGAGPTIVGNVRIDNTAIGWRERWAIGNLKGVYGNTGDIVGVAFGRPDTGMHCQIDEVGGVQFLDQFNTAYSYWDMNGNIRVGLPNQPHLSYEAVSGTLRIRAANNADRFVVAPSGDVMTVGGLQVGANSYVRSANASWLSGYGFLLQAESNGSARVLIGNATADRIVWDGANLGIVSRSLTIDQDAIRIAAHTTSAWDRAHGYTFVPVVSSGYQFGLAAVDMSSFRQLFLDNVANVPGGTTVMTRLSVGAQGPVTAILDVSHQSGGYPEIIVGFNDVHLRPWTTPSANDLGTPTYRWRYAFIQTAVGIAMSGVPTYQIQLGADSAGKPGTSTWTVISDARAKRDLVRVEHALDRLAQIEVVDFTYTGEFGTPEGDRGIGILAQDAAPILPRSIRQREDGVYDWNAHELFMLNVVAVQELAARVAALERQQGGENDGAHAGSEGRVE
jgi:Chaperone of endosialidase